MNKLREDALRIINNSIDSVLPEHAVKSQLSSMSLGENIYLVAIGKAAWRMAKAAKDFLKEKIKNGIVITKYEHSQGIIEGLQIYEAGHPIPDENTLKATRKVIEMIKNLGKDDEVLFLVSGGGSSLFELPNEGIELEDLQKLNNDLLKSGANIVEINTIRKHISQVKGGQFAKIAEPAKIYALILSDVIGDRLDSIASGPAYPDSTTLEDVKKIISKYNLSLPENLLHAFSETPKSLRNVDTYIIGSVNKVCENAKLIAEQLGYNSIILTTTLDCEAKEAGLFLASIARELIEKDRPINKPCAVILGGETVVKVQGNGLGGRNQELALSAARGIYNYEDVISVSVGTDGTDGPTDAAGGIVDGQTINKLIKQNIDVEFALKNNDSYTALDAIGGLIRTGPTGTNVNDLIFILCGA